MEPASLEPVPLVTAATVAARVGISPESAARLLASGYAGRTYRTATDLMIEILGLETLVERHDMWADTSVPALNVRVKPAVWAADEERYVGWHADLSDEQQVAALSKWWNVRDAEKLIGAAFVASIGGWVVYVAQIIGVTTDRGQRAFDLGPATAAQCAAYQGRRLTPTRGRSVLRFGLE